jgi:hypothetical protein
MTCLNSKKKKNTNDLRENDLRENDLREISLNELLYLL